MALTHFFKINFPYGIKRNESDEWSAFNRDYFPLGLTSNKILDKDQYEQQFNGIHYYGLTEKILLELAVSESSIKRDSSGKINSIHLYNDSTNPSKSSKNWDDYLQRLKKLGNVKIQPGK
jgi:hypothetical protein